MLKEVIPVWIRTLQDRENVFSRSCDIYGRIFLTENKDVLKQLTEKKLPCIFIQEPDDEEGIYGADLVFLKEKDADMPEQSVLLNTWKRHYQIPWTIAETKRLLIRESVITDLPHFLKMYEEEKENPDVVPFTEEPERELEEYIRFRYPVYGYGLWSVVEKSTGRVIGRAGFGEFSTEDGQIKTELSYLISSDSRKKGYAYEAAKAILSYGREELELKEICVRTSAQNQASASLAKKLGVPFWQ